jgi:hypothetical protein
LLVLILLHAFPFANRAQDRLELGGFLGTSFYMGDLNPAVPFRQSHIAFGGIARYAVTDRVALRASAFRGEISGDYPVKGVVFPQAGASYNFLRTVGDVALMTEYNFRSYDHPFISTSVFTPYLAIGVGTIVYQRYLIDSQNQNEKPVFVLSLPFGVGVKYKLTDWIRIGAEWSFRKTFVDDLDYVGENLVIDPADPYGFKREVLTHNNDWVSFAGVTVTFNMLKRNTECNAGFKKKK